MDNVSIKQVGSVYYTVEILVKLDINNKSTLLKEAARLLLCEAIRYESRSR